MNGDGVTSAVDILSPILEVMWDATNPDVEGITWHSRIRPLKWRGWVPWWLRLLAWALATFQAWLLIEVSLAFMYLWYDYGLDGEDAGLIVASLIMGALVLAFEATLLISIVVQLLKYGKLIDDAERPVAVEWEIEEHRVRKPKPPRPWVQWTPHRFKHAFPRTPTFVSVFCIGLFSLFPPIFLQVLLEEVAFGWREWVLMVYAAAEMAVAIGGVVITRRALTDWEEQTPEDEQAIRAFREFDDAVKRTNEERERAKQATVRVGDEAEQKLFAWAVPAMSLVLPGFIGLAASAALIAPWEGPCYCAESDDDDVVNRCVILDDPRYCELPANYVHWMQFYQVSILVGLLFAGSLGIWYMVDALSCADKAPPLIMRRSACMNFFVYTAISLCATLGGILYLAAYTNLVHDPTSFDVRRNCDCEDPDEIPFLAPSWQDTTTVCMRRSAAVVSLGIPLLLFSAWCFRRVDAGCRRYGTTYFMAVGKNCTLSPEGDALLAGDQTKSAQADTSQPEGTVDHVHDGVADLDGSHDSNAPSGTTVIN